MCFAGCFKLKSDGFQILYELQVDPQEQFRTTCLTSFQAHPVTAGRVRAMLAGCGLSTRRPWGGSVVCNEWEGGTPHGESFRRFEHAAPPCDYYSYYNHYFQRGL